MTHPTQTYNLGVATDRAANFLEHLAARRRTLREEIEEDVAPLRGLSLAERGRLVESVCRDAMAILRGRQDFEQALRAQEPRSEDWAAVVQKYRSHGRD